MSNQNPHSLTALRRAGLVSWSLLGIIALVVVAAAALSAVSGILVPLVVAVIVAMVLEPLVVRLIEVGVPRTLAIAFALLLAVLVGAGTVAIVVWGVVQQWSDTYRQSLLGWQSFVSWLDRLDLDPRWLDQGRAAVEGHAARLGQGAIGAVGSTFYGAITLVIGVFFALFFLFFALRDAGRFPAWISRITGFGIAEVDEVIGLSRHSVRGYFKGTAITALLTAPIFMIPLLILGVPLAIPIFVLYFFPSFIPFVGAWITGAFVVLIALGSGGPWAAAIMGIPSSSPTAPSRVQSVRGRWGRRCSCIRWRCCWRRLSVAPSQVCSAWFWELPCSRQWSSLSPLSGECVATPSRSRNRIRSNSHLFATLPCSFILCGTA